MKIQSEGAKILTTGFVYNELLAMADISNTLRNGAQSERTSRVYSQQEKERKRCYICTDSLADWTNTRISFDLCRQSA